MKDYTTFKRSAVRCWERRRIWYNLVLIPPSLLTYMIGAAVASAGDPVSHHYYVLFLFALSALGANICYTFAYGLEFFFGSDDPASRWSRVGRPSAFALGTIFSMLLAAVGGSNIASLEYAYEIK